jgi:hypothetical protein
MKCLVLLEMIAKSETSMLGMMVKYSAEPRPIILSHSEVEYHVGIM